MNEGILQTLIIHPTSIPKCQLSVIGLSPALDSSGMGLSRVSTIENLEGTLTLRICPPSVMTAEALSLRQDVATVVADHLGGVNAVVLNLSAVQIMSSRGFEALVVLHHACKDRGIKFTCSTQTEMFRQLVARMGLTTLFPSA